MKNWVGSRAIAGAMVVVAFTVAACDTTSSPAMTDTPPPAPGPSATSTIGAPPSPTDSAKRTALVVYAGMWDSYAAAAATSDWQSPKLAQFATGAALSAMSRGLYADQYGGLVSLGHPINNPIVSSADPADIPTKIGISDCGDSTNWKKYRADTGQPVEGQPGGRRQISAVVARQADGSWRVSDFGVKEVGSC